MNALFIYAVLPVDIRKVISKIIQNSSLEPLSVVTILSFLGGYFLFALNVPIIRWFEGYPWQNSPGIRWLYNIKIQHHRLQRNKLMSDLAALESKAQLLRKKLSDLERELGAKPPLDYDQILVEIEEIEIQKTWYVKKLQHFYPVSKSPYLPTRLGNVIASFEDYSYNKYEIDSVTIWPRFVPVLSQEKYSLYLEKEKANFDFLINLCLIIVLFCVELFVVGLLFLDELKFNLWLILIGLMFCVAYVLYCTSVTGALGWGNTVRVAFDLYRFELLASLKIKLPKNDIEERRTWDQISNYFRNVKNSEPLEVNYEKLADLLVDEKSLR